MAYDFNECLKALREAKKEFTEELYPLSQFDNLAPAVGKNGGIICASKIKADLLRTAEQRFNYSRRTKADFYGYLFETLYDAGLSKSDGTEASAMYVVYQNALKVFPKFAEAPFVERYKVLIDACKKARKIERNLNGYAMFTYLAIVAHGLDTEICLPDDGFGQKASYDSPWRTPDGQDHQRIYVKVFQNFKKLRDFDTGQVRDPHYPVWTSFRPKEKYRGVNRTMLSCDIWLMLIGKPEEN